VRDAVDLRQVFVDVGVRGGVAGRREVAVDEVAVEVGDDHVVRAQFVVADAGGFDH